MFKDCKSLGRGGGTCFNPNTEAEAGRSLDFEASQPTYIVSSKTARVTQRNSVSRNQIFRMISLR